MPVFAVEDYEAQEMLASIRDRTVNDSYCGGIEDILPEEISWHNEYIEGELEANLDLNLDGKKYEVYEIPLDVNIIDNEPSFSQYFQDSIIAKGGVGSATIQLWAINTLLEIYKRKCDNNEIFNGKRENINISKKSCQYIVYAYTRLIQDMVVRGIKHNEGGSSGFSMFELENLSVKMTKTARNIFLNVIKIPKDTLYDFELMLHWMKDSKYLDSVTKYISMFNSGKKSNTMNESHLLEIEKNSFYGYLLRDMQKVIDEVSGKVPTSKVINLEDNNELILEEKKQPINECNSLMDILQG